MTDDKILQLLGSPYFEDNLIAVNLLSKRSLFSLLEFFKIHGVKGYRYEVVWTEYAIKIGNKESHKVDTVRNEEEKYVLWMGYGDLLLVNGLKYNYDEKRNT